MFYRNNSPLYSGLQSITCVMMFCCQTKQQTALYFCLMWALPAAAESFMNIPALRGLPLIKSLNQTKVLSQSFLNIKGTKGKKMFLQETVTFMALHNQKNKRKVECVHSSLKQQETHSIYIYQKLLSGETTRPQRSTFNKLKLTLKFLTINMCNLGLCWGGFDKSSVS